MPAFRDVIDVPLVVRKARRSRDQVRQDLGIPLQSLVVIFIYGGQPPGADWILEEDCLPEGWICIVCSAGKPPGDKPLPSRNFILADEDAYTPDLIAASDVCLGKIGYGTTSECLAHSIPLVFTRRDFFNEEPFLRKLLEVHCAAVEIRRRDFLAGNWAPYLERALSLGPIRYDQPTDGAQVVARLLGEAVEEWRRNGGRRGSGTTGTGTTISPPLSPRREGEFHHLDGRGRLRDAIVWGYMMQRHEAAPSKHAISDVLEWYTQGKDPYESSSLSLEEEEGGGGGEPPSIINGGGGREGEKREKEELKAVRRLEREREKGIVDGYDVIEGPDLGMFPDTVRFLGLLRTLHQQQQQQQGEGGGGGGREKVAGGGLKPPSVITTTTSTTTATTTTTTIGVGSGVGHGNSKEKRQQASDLPERRAAVSLFRWDTESSSSTHSDSSNKSDDDIVITRAPGRLDVMGGISDYSGALVLQGTAAQGCHVALQLHPPDKQPRWKHMMAASRQKKMVPSGGDLVVVVEDRPALRIVSFNADATDRGPAFDMDLDEFFIDPGSGGTDSGGDKDKKGGNTTTTTPKATLEPISYEAAQDYFKKDPSVGWAAYVAGSLLVLAKERGVRYTKGISILISSEVPEGKGVSSSAAVEVATMMAVAAAHNITLAGHEVALLCQMVENLVVGAPCGVMDQMASALGEADCLLALRCQPAEVVGKVHIPSHMRIWGVDSGIRHSVGGSDYGAVRIGAFMGLKILSTKSERRTSGTGGTTGNGGTGGEGEKEEEEEGGTTTTATAVKEEESKEEQDEEQKQLNPLGNGYLANISPSQYTSIYERMLPDSITVEEFVSTYGRHWDAATVGRIDPGQKYAVKKPTAHPIFENFRVGAFKQILTASSSGSSIGGGSNDDDTDDDASLSAWKDEQMNVLGELMLQSHVSYSQCGLGSQGTDRLVQLVCEHQDTNNNSGKVLYGGKITGGGSGGTVCILGRAGERGERAVREVMERYAEETGHVPFLFNGSSPGAVAFGCLRLRKGGGGGR